MSASVVNLRGEQSESPARAAFIQTVAEGFDSYVAEYGAEPDACVFVCCGVRQDAQTGWFVGGESEGAPTSVLSLAAVALMKEALSDAD